MTAGRFDLTRWAFLRLLAIVYAIAFASLAVQITGLVGEAGILPAGDYLSLAHARLGAYAWWRLPTLCWLTGTGDVALLALAWGGVALSGLLFANLAPALVCPLLWLAYLSLSVVGQVFLNFQWDALLLETGLLACLWAPCGLRPGIASGTPRSVVWLLWLLVFKLNVMSGLVKLTSGDPTWWDLSALEYHYWTTCLPTWTGWFAHHLPSSVHRTSAGVMFFVELVVPFGILGPRRLRHATAGVLAALQIGIAATGNYGFFNLLTIVLCVPLLDDPAIGRILPTRLTTMPPALDRPGFGLRVGRGILVAALATASVASMLVRFISTDSLPAPVPLMLRTIAPLRSVNGYGLFANMTTSRPEIMIEGSRDGRTWTPYVFRWKPGEPTRRPAFMQPHMPRLDWQMWFAALQGTQRAHWFRPFLARLAEGSPPVLGLLAADPFPEGVPRHLRSTVHLYEFSTPEERADTGRWWTRRFVGPYDSRWDAPPGHQ